MDEDARRCLRERVQALDAVDVDALIESVLPGEVVKVSEQVFRARAARFDRPFKDDALG